MEHKFMLTDDLLWDYADGFLQGEEKQQVDAYLREHPEQRARLKAIMTEKRAFSTFPLEKPVSGFSQQVMAAWAAEQMPEKAFVLQKNKGNDWVLWGIAAIFGLMIIAPFLMTPAAAPAGSAWQIPEAYIPQFQAPTFDWTGFFNSAWLRNTALLTIVFMGLKILDKYLQVRNLRLSGH